MTISTGATIQGLPSNDARTAIATESTGTATVTLPVGAAAMAASTPVTIATDDARIGPVNETAPATDIASSGLNGRLQRVAQDVTTMSAKLPAALGATTTAASMSVTTPTDQSSGVALTITRPANATPYTALDVVGGALTFTNLAKGAGQIMITSASLQYQVAALPANMANMRVHLYNVTPPSAIADNGAWDMASADWASYLGFFDLGTLVDHGSALYVELNGINKQITTASGNVFAYLETIIGFTPAGNSEVLILTLHAVQV